MRPLARVPLRRDYRRPSFTAGRADRERTAASLLERAKFRLVRDVVPTLLMLLTAGSLTLLAAKYIAETKKAHAAEATRTASENGAGVLPWELAAPKFSAGG